MTRSTAKESFDFARVAVMRKTASAQRQPFTQAYQLYVELEWVRPKVWRRFLVPTTIELPWLHTTLLFGTGWQGGHVHKFVFGNDNYGRKEPGLDLPEVMDEERVTLRDALGARKTFVYVYDYGDNWRHKVKVEKIVTLDKPISTCVCVGGENACPPEDVGGAPHSTLGQELGCGKGKQAALARGDRRAEEADPQRQVLDEWSRALDADLEHQPPDDLGER